MKLPSIRKGCMHCGSPLIGMRQKILRCCANCASQAREGFALMGQGRFQEGYLKTRSVIGNREDQNKIDAVARNALTKKESTIRRKLKRRGLTPQEIDDGLAEWKKGLGVEEIEKSDSKI